MSDYTLVFDGGSRGNPGRGYGSFRLRQGRGPWGPPVRLEFGDRVTNNEAEYRTLLAALESLLELCPDPEEATVEVRTDSQLVVRQLQGAWRVRAANLRPLHRAVCRLSDRFAAVRWVWQPRRESVRLLGH